MVSIWLRGAKADLPALGLIAFYVLALAIVFHVNGLPFFRFGSYIANTLLYISAVTMVISVPFLWKLAKLRPPSPFAFAKDYLKAFKIRDRLMPSMPILLGLCIFMPAFSASKSAIPYYNAYRFDALFAELDRSLHGTDAWKFVHPVLGYPLVTFAINGIYHLWILLPYVGVPLVCGWIEQPRVRLQFLVTYLLCWILIGTVLATALASVGPCFVEYFYHDRTFTPLMAYLSDVDAVYPLPALDVQQTLVRWQELGSHGLGRGISAMPSMHVSIACLFAIVGWRHSRGAGIATTLFLLFVLLGSVHLGYHYAVDGYLSLALTPLLWRLSGWALGKTEGGKTGSFAVTAPLARTAEPRATAGRK